MWGSIDLDYVQFLCYPADDMRILAFTSETGFHWCIVSPATISGVLLALQQRGVCVCVLVQILCNTEICLGSIIRIYQTIFMDSISSQF